MRRSLEGSLARHTRASCLAVVVVLGAACQGQPSEAQPDTKQAAELAAPAPAPASATPPATEPTPTAPPVILPEQPSGTADTPATADAAAVVEPRDAAYFTLNTGCGGVVRLADGKFELVNKCGSKIDADPSGNLFIMYGIGEWGIQTVIEPISPAGAIISVPPEIKSVMAFVASGNGQFWIAANSKVGFYDGEAWRMDSVEGTIMRNWDTANRILVDTAGGVWVGSNSGIYLHGPSGYEQVAIAGLEEEGIGGFYTAPNGDAWLTLRAGSPLHLQGGSWKPIDFVVPGHKAHGGALAARSDGTMAMWLPESDLLAIRTAAGAVHTLELDAVGSVSNMTADESGRLWIKSNVGIVVVASDLHTVERTYPIESIPAFFGSENNEYEDVLQILVRGAGPTLPEAARAKGWVKGVVLRDGKPLAKAKIEMCEDPIHGDLGNAGTPCEGEQQYGGETRPDGSFVLTKVKPGLYELAVQDGGPAYDWVVVEDIDCSGLEGKDQLDLGNIDAPKR